MLEYSRETLPDAFRGDGAEIEPYLVVPRLLHDLENAPGDDVAWSEVGQRMETFHEGLPGFRTQHSALAADGFRDEKPVGPGEVEGRGMKLYELEIQDLCPGPEGHGQSVTGGDGRVCRLPVEPACATRGENRLARPDSLELSCFVRDQGPDTGALAVKKVDREGARPAEDVFAIQDSFHQ